MFIISYSHHTFYSSNHNETKQDEWSRLKRMRKGMAMSSVLERERDHRCIGGIYIFGTTTGHIKAPTKSVCVRSFLFIPRRFEVTGLNELASK